MSAPSDDDESTVRAAPPVEAPAQPQKPAPTTTELTVTQVDPPREVVDDEATRLNAPARAPEEDEATRLNSRAPPGKAVAREPLARAPVARAPLARKPLPRAVVAVLVATLGLLLLGLWRTQHSSDGKKARQTKDDKRGTVDDFFEGK